MNFDKRRPAWKNTWTWGKGILTDTYKIRRLLSSSLFLVVLAGAASGMAAAACTLLSTSGAVALKHCYFYIKPKTGDTNAGTFHCSCMKADGKFREIVMYVSGFWKMMLPINL